MKNSRLVLLAALLVGSVILSFAGPGPQFWIRPADSKAVLAAAAPNAPVAADCAACACCRKG